MNLTTKEIVEILIPRIVFDPVVFENINPKWLEWASAEIESGRTIGMPPATVGDDPKYMIHYLRILRLASIFYEHKNNTGVPWNIVDEIVKKAFDYCEIDRPGYPFLYLGKRMAETQGLIKSAQEVTRVAMLTPKGRRVLLEAIDNAEPPSIVSTVLQSDDGALQLTEDDVWDILDPEHVFRDIGVEVSNEWLNYVANGFSSIGDIDTATAEADRTNVIEPEEFEHYDPYSTVDEQIDADNEEQSNGSDNDMPSTEVDGLDNSGAILPSKRKAGRKSRSKFVKSQEKILYDGWIQFSESGSGTVKDYAEDKGKTEEEMRKLIDRNRPRRPRNNSEK